MIVSNDVDINVKNIKYISNTDKKWVKKIKTQEVTRECGNLKFMIPRSTKFAGSFIVLRYIYICFKFKLARRDNF